jgi:cytochrome c oxidase subunit 4
MNVMEKSQTVKTKDKNSIHGHVSHTKEYIFIFVILTVLTIVELYVPGLSISKFKKVTSLIALAFGKASVVGYYYMHLKEEKAWLKFIALVPLAAVLYAAVLMLESFYR